MADAKGLLVTPVGFDPNGNPRALEVTTEDLLKISVADAIALDVSVITSSAIELAAGTNEIGKVQAREYGWIDGAWQKNALLFGYSGVIRERKEDLNLKAGTNTLSGVNVPNGEIWVVTHVAINYTGTITNVIISAYIYDGLESYHLFNLRTVISGLIYDRQGWWVLKPGDSIRMDIAGATLNDDAVLRYTGFRIDIDQ